MRPLQIALAGAILCSNTTYAQLEEITLTKALEEKDHYCRRSIERWIQRYLYTAGPVQQQLEKLSGTSRTRNDLRP